MLVTFSEAAKIAGVSKGAIRKAALETRKLRTDWDEQGVWRVDVADIQRLHAPEAAGWRSPRLAQMRRNDTSLAPGSQPSGEFRFIERT
jgi:hypothetical protein